MMGHASSYVYVVVVSILVDYSQTSCQLTAAEGSTFTKCCHRLEQDNSNGVVWKTRSFLGCMAP